MIMNFPTYSALHLQQIWKIFHQILVEELFCGCCIFQLTKPASLFDKNYYLLADPPDNLPPLIAH